MALMNAITIIDNKDEENQIHKNNISVSYIRGPLSYTILFFAFYYLPKNKVASSVYPSICAKIPTAQSSYAYSRVKLVALLVLSLGTYPSAI